MKKVFVNSGVMETATGSKVVEVVTTRADRLIGRNIGMRRYAPATTTTLKEVLATNIVVKTVLGSRGRIMALGVGNKKRTGKMVIATCSSYAMGKCVKGPAISLPLGPRGKGLGIKGTVNGSNALVMVGSLKLGRPCMKRTPVFDKRVTRSLSCCFAMSRRIPSTMTLKILISESCSVGITNNFVVRLVPNTSRLLKSLVACELRRFASIAKRLTGKGAVIRVLRSVFSNVSLGVGGSARVPGCGYSYSEDGIRETLVDVKCGSLGRLCSSNGARRLGYRFYGGTCRFARRGVKRLLGVTARAGGGWCVFEGVVGGVLAGGFFVCVVVGVFSG